MPLVSQMMTSLRQDYYTPQEVLELARSALRPVGGMLLDPATGPTNPTRAGTFYDGATPERDGLEIRWELPWFCNPPYGRGVGVWVQAACDARAPGILLTPARPDTAWWGNLYRHADAVAFWRGRMRFSAPGAPRSDPAPFPTQLALLHAPPSLETHFRAVFRDHCSAIVPGGRQLELDL